MADRIQNKATGIKVISQVFDRLTATYDKARVLLRRASLPSLETFGKLIMYSHCDRLEKIPKWVATRGLKKRKSG